METVTHHLMRAGELCAQFLLPAGWSDWGTILGVTHDYGKLSARFQAVLRGEQTGVNHALPSAILLESMYASKRPSTAHLLSAVTASHHSALKGYGDYEQQIQHALTGSGENLDRDGRTVSLFGPEEYQQAMAEWRKNFTRSPLSPAPSFKSDEDPALSKMLFERMLFSALVDADWCSSAEHFEPDYLAQHTGHTLDAGTSMERLLRILQEKRSASTASASLNEMRDHLFEACLNAGNLEPGLFTLTAPTGLGKTMALLAFALQHCERWGKRRIILILPYLSIIEQNGKDYRDIIPDLLEIHSNVHWSEDSRALADRWDAPCIITTNVSFFEPLFSAQPGQCRHLHQFANSVILLDEAQSLPVHLLDATLRTLKLLCEDYHCTVLLSTATQPSFQYRPGLEWHPREIVPEVSSLFAAIQRVTWTWRQDTPITLSALALEISDVSQCCVIVNLKRHARTLWNHISALRHEEEIFYLTTDLCPAHRSDLLEIIHRRLKDGLPCCLIATQCIEAGVDLDFPVMYRALAPLESLIQAAGRCNRNGDQPDGQITIFTPAEEGRLYPSEEYGRGALCVLNLLSRHGGTIDCSDVACIDEYYQLLYSNAGGDRSALQNAIRLEDYVQTEKQYRMIDPAGGQIIVPYAGRQKQYDAVCAKLDQEGFNWAVIRSAQELTVSCYDVEQLRQYCQNLMYRSPESGQLVPSNYYLLGISQFYDSKRGLFWDNIFDGIF